MLIAQQFGGGKTQTLFHRRIGLALKLFDGIWVRLKNGWHPGKEDRSKTS
jgi:hypothetical protein